MENLVTVSVLLAASWLVHAAGMSVGIVLLLVGVAWLMPKATVRFLVWSIGKVFYRIRVHGLENIPLQGGVLLTPNHVSWLDGFLVMLVCPRPVRMLVDAGNFRNRLVRTLAGQWNAIMMSPGPKPIVRALKAAKGALEAGEVVGVFPEGGITRTGQMLGFRPGVVKVVQGTDAVVVPIYIDELWGSVFSFERGRFFWKWPRRWPYPVSLHFGEPLRDVRSAHQIRQAVAALGAKAVEGRMSGVEPLSQSLVRACKKRRFSSKIADSSGVDITGAQALMRALILRRLLRRGILDADERHVGILLPPTAAAVLANMAVTLDRRIAVNLNYTVSSSVMNECLDLADIRHVITSRKFMEKMAFDLRVELVYLEDLRDKVLWSDKLVGALMAYVVPGAFVSATLGLGQIKKDDVLTVIFTSGSTGTPKGVMLTYGNIKSNVEAIQQVINLNRRDVIVGILPFFHSFGFTVTLWCVMTLDIKGVYHFNPLEARQVGKLCKQHGGTVLLSTPTFLRSYLRRCEKEDFATLDTVVAGAERLPVDLCDAFEEKFGVRPVEGYGATELSPLVSVNVPPSRTVPFHQESLREESVGRCVPGVSAKIVGLETGEELAAGQQGMLLVTGANVMRGYLKAPDKTAEVVRDGWYVTGDLAEIDEDGFLHITGRESRFSKIGGEMVPHIKVEESLQRLVGGDDESPTVAVTAVSDEKKGERLVVLHKQIAKTPCELCAQLKEEGLPNLFIPSTDCFLEVDELPVLGSGKLDLKGIRRLAEERFSKNT